MTDNLKHEIQIVLPEAMPTGQEVDLRALLAGILSAKRWVITAVLVAIVIGGLYVLSAKPVYQADSLMQVAYQIPSPNARPDGVSNIFTNQTAVRTQISIINSRTILGEAVERLHLDIVATPHRLPVVGDAWIQVKRQIAKSDGERIQVRRFDVPTAWQGKEFELVASGMGRYRLYAPDGERIGEGGVGQVQQMRAQGRESNVTIDVGQLDAPAGTRFDVTRLTREAAIVALQQRLAITETDAKSSGDQQENGGVLQLVLDGNDPVLTAKTLNTIATISLQQNVARRSNDAEQKLAFIEQQLPQAKIRMEQAKQALSIYQQSHNTVDTEKESAADIQRKSDIDKELLSLEMQKAELEQKFTNQHPALIALNQKMRDLQEQRVQLYARLQQLPTFAKDTGQLRENVKSATELYDSLENKYQELKMVKAGTVGNLRLLDPALIPGKPVKPRKMLILAASGVTGLFAGVLLALASVMRRRVTLTPEFIEHDLGLPVMAAIPHSADQARLSKAGSQVALPLLAAETPKDPAVEQLRGLRACLQYASKQAGGNIIAITGPSLHTGKSFVAMNLACLLAAARKRVLLLDADLRQGQLAQHLNLPVALGLSEVLMDQCLAEEAIRPTKVPGLSLMATGRYPEQPGELLMFETFPQLMRALSDQYDYLVCDTPPILAVADAINVCKLAGVNILVARPDNNSADEVGLAVKKLAQSGIAVQGIVLNDMDPYIHSATYGQAAYYQAAHDLRNH